MVAHGEVFVVGLQGVCGAAKQHADVVGVVQAGVEVGVVAYAHGEVGRDVLERDERLFLQGGVVLQHVGVGRVDGEDALDVLSHDAVDGAAERGEGV